MIRQREPSPHYWRRSEEGIVRRIRRDVRTLVPGEGGLRLLDAGCGEGRLLVKIGDLFADIVAADPDRARLDRAQVVVARQPWRRNVSLLPCSIQDLPGVGRFDAILCSHILQHVPRADVDRVLSALACRLRPEGRLFLLTSHSQRPRDLFTVARRDGDRFVEEVVSPAAFDRAASRGDRGLPVHLFSAAGLQRRLAKHGLDTLSLRVFHVLEPRGVLAAKTRGARGARDDVANSSRGRQARLGRDLFVIARLGGPRSAGR